MKNFILIILLGLALSVTAQSHLLPARLYVSYSIYDYNIKTEKTHTYKLGLAKFYLNTTNDTLIMASYVDDEFRVISFKLKNREDAGKTYKFEAIPILSNNLLLKYYIFIEKPLENSLHADIILMLEGIDIVTVFENR